MTYFKLPNSIFELGLKANELVVLTYLCSIHKQTEYQDYVVVKHEVIAAACGYASRDSAQNVVKSLAEKGFITTAPRYNTFTGVTLANGYIVNLPVGSTGYFKVDRKIFRTVSTRAGTTATAIYLYILRCMSSAKVAFPSLAGIRDAVHLTIATIVKKIRALQEQLLLHKQQRRKRDGSFTHNLYTLLFGELPQKGQRKKHVMQERVFSKESYLIPSKGIASCLYSKAKRLICQEGRLKNLIGGIVKLLSGHCPFRHRLRLCQRNFTQSLF
ncbi:MAG: hypothetical protein ACERKO_06535 [Acetanaerobacterium sp.]